MNKERYVFAHDYKKVRETTANKNGQDGDHCRGRAFIDLGTNAYCEEQHTFTFESS